LKNPAPLYLIRSTNKSPLQGGSPDLSGQGGVGASGTKSPASKYKLAGLRLPKQLWPAKAGGSSGLRPPKRLRPAEAGFALRMTIVLLRIGVFLFIPLLGGVRGGFSFAQSTAGIDTSNADTGRVEIIQDSKIAALVKKHIAINKRQKGIPGYRVQIFFGSKRKDALEVKADFLNKYPDINAYTKYDEPYFKVRVGDYRTQLKAQKCQNQISGDFPNAFIVEDLIRQPFLIDN